MFNRMPNIPILEVSHIIFHRYSFTSCSTTDHPDGCPTGVSISRKLQAKGDMNTFERFLRYALLRRKGWVIASRRKPDYKIPRSEWQWFQDEMPEDVSMGTGSEMVNYLKECLGYRISKLTLKWGEDEWDLWNYAALQP